MQETEYPSPWKEFKEQFWQHKGAQIGLALSTALVFIAVFAPLISPFDPKQVFTQHLRLPPFFSETSISGFWLGTDDVGRDILSRLIYGARVSLMIGLSVVFFSASVGGLLGMLAGFYEGKVEWIIMRITDLIMTFPSILLAIVIASVLGPGLFNTILAVSVVAIPSFIRIMRVAVKEQKNKQFVQASRTFGASSGRLLFIEILPNCTAPLIVQASLGLSDGILNAAALGFLGLGAQPPTAEWGLMLADSKAFIQSSPWMVTLPGLCILVSVLGLNLLGDGLRDLMDPRLKR